MRVYICSIMALAALAVTALYAWGPEATVESAAIAGILCAIGWLYGSLTYELDQKGTRASVGFLLFPAAAFAVANWTVPLIVCVTVFALEIRRRAPLHKTLFNSTSLALANAVSIIAFRATGGSGWAGHDRIPVVSVIALLVAHNLTSSGVTSGVIALSSGQPLGRTWRAVTGKTIIDDVLVSPFTAVIAYTAVKYPIGWTIVGCTTLIWINRLYQTNRALQRVSHEMLELMVSAIEARDPYTSGHSRRVSRMSVEIARAIGLSHREVERIRVAGLLHDVGKIHEKYAPILSKPDRLTRDEWILMKEHPVDGENLVRNVSQLHDVLPAVRHHHERWDGAGYPDGLRGESIPLMARVMAIADTIDAMTSDRSYRRGLSVEEVRKEVERCAGTQFDPAIVGKLLAGPYWDALFAPMESDNATRYELKLVSDSNPAPEKVVA
ncbi:HD-GYP domain-containing protein [Gemmatirosa kalamazoonensis]|uniref:HD-GYP domain-containing protein n=1 Tax=Gemmatirosa kalamazoonensis TaxID=861299 RepID=UPI00130E6590|nr:HD-GYP domain-containing protein [Gemmatirosa kalamazoonensis]